MRKLFYLVIICVGVFSCSQQSKLNLEVEKTSAFNANCYLLYDEVSKEAALIDVGGDIDNLNSFIEENKLNPKYIFITHMHPDHVAGIPAFREKFPDAKLCCSHQDFYDMDEYYNWEEIFDTSYVVTWKKNQAIEELMNFDYEAIGDVNIYPEDGQIFNLGNEELKVLHTSGHSRGSISIYAAGKLFTGDLLFKGYTGELKYKLFSAEDLKNSVQRLFNELPDSTIVYPGHGMHTTIGAEKGRAKL